MASSSADAEEEYLRARNAGPSQFRKDSSLETRNESSGSAQEASGSGDSGEEPERDESVALDDTLTAGAALALKEKGNELFKTGDISGSLEKYVAALRSAHLADHDRAVLHANCAAVHLRREAWREAKDAATRALDIEESYSKALLRRKKAAEMLQDWGTAAKDAKALGASHAEIVALEAKAKQKAEKETAEAMEQLKGLGNSLLSNFGLSLDSFQMDKDPETGGYSVKMKQ